MQAVDRERVATVSLANHPGLAERTYEVLREEILGGGLPPGTRLSVVDLASRLGVSRSPIKDALSRLCAEGLVSETPRKGYSVACLDAEEAAELMDASLVVQLGAAEIGVHLADAPHLARMRQVLVEMEQLLSPDGQCTDYPRLKQLDRDLHILVVGSAKNRRLLDIYRALSSQTHAIPAGLAATLQTRPASKLFDEHRAIVASFEAHDPRACRAAITQHLACCNSRFAAAPGNH